MRIQGSLHGAHLVQPLAAVELAQQLLLHRIATDAVARAIALSYEKYCSVWHSMRQDIVFTTSHDVQP